MSLMDEAKTVFHEVPTWAWWAAGGGGIALYLLHAHSGSSGSSGSSVPVLATPATTGTGPIDTGGGSGSPAPTFPDYSQQFADLGTAEQQNATALNDILSNLSSLQLGYGSGNTQPTDYGTPSLPPDYGTPTDASVQQATVSGGVPSSLASAPSAPLTAPNLSNMLQAAQGAEYGTMAYLGTPPPSYQPPAMGQLSPANLNEYLQQLQPALAGSAVPPVAIPQASSGGTPSTGTGIVGTGAGPNKKVT